MPCVYLEWLKGTFRIASESSSGSFTKVSRIVTETKASRRARKFQTGFRWTKTYFMGFQEASVTFMRALERFQKGSSVPVGSTGVTGGIFGILRKLHYLS